MRDILARTRLSGPVFNAILVFGAYWLGKQVLLPDSSLRIAAAGALMVLLAIPAIRHPKFALVALFAWLPFLGLARRFLIASTGPTPLDPLLLVSSAITIMIFVTLMVSRQAKLGGTPLAKLVFFFLVVAILELFNPYQQTYLVALTGVMFVITPMLMFLIARSVADEKLMRTIQMIVIVTGIFAALWGIKQVFIGFTGFEKTWLACCGYGALIIHKTTRPFSTFSNAVEFSTYMGFAIVICYSRLIYSKGSVRALYLAALSVMAYAGFLVGSRGFVVGTLLAIIVLTGLRVRNRFFTIMIILAMIGSALLWSATKTSGTCNDVEAGAEQLTCQQTSALADPTDTSKSTLPAHAVSAWNGILFAMRERPFGVGTGAITRGGAKFGQIGVSAGTELDIGNSFVAFGVIGGLLYAAVVLMAYRQLYRLRRLTMNPMWVAVLGMAILSFGQWQNGGAYAIASLLWLSLGATDRAFMQVREDERLGLPEAA